MRFEIKYLTVGQWNENSYLLSYGNEAWLVDPGDDFEHLDKYFETWNFKILGIINTHGHFDHIGAVQKFKDKYDLPFYIHSKDRQLVQQANLFRRLAGNTAIHQTPKIEFFLDDIKELQIGNKMIKIHFTPGHSNGSVCFEIENHLFSGDILINGKCGRTDLPGGNEALLNSSIEFLVENFKGYTLYPGHGIPFVLNESMINDMREKK